MYIKMDGSEKPLPDGCVQLTDNGVSAVFRGNDSYVYKRSTPFLIENELYCLKQMAKYCCVPDVVRYDKYTLQMTDLGESETVTDIEFFKYSLKLVMVNLHHAGIRHGDLTEYAIIVKANHPFLIDFAESRLEGDPRPDKRPEGDEYWMNRTMEKLCART